MGSISSEAWRCLSLTTWYWSPWFNSVIFYLWWLATHAGDCLYLRWNDQDDLLLHGSLTVIERASSNVSLLYIPFTMRDHLRGVLAMTPPSWLSRVIQPTPLRLMEISSPMAGSSWWTPCCGICCPTQPSSWPVRIWWSLELVCRCWSSHWTWWCSCVPWMFPFHLSEPTGAFWDKHLRSDGRC